MITDAIVHICTFLANPLPVLCCSKELYELRFHDMFFPLAFPRPSIVPTNYEMFKRKKLLQTHCFLCGGEMGRFVSMMICKCMGFYPKMHPLCIDTLQHVGTTVCPFCHGKSVYFVFRYTT